MEELWAAGDGLTQAEDTLAALHHVALLLHGRIPGAWKKVRTWRRHEMPRCAPPIPPAVVRGIAGLEWVQGRLGVALGILMGFHCVCRGCEVLRLRFCDCMHFGGTVLGFSKTGSRKRTREQVTITDSSLTNLFRYSCRVLQFFRTFGVHVSMKCPGIFSRVLSFFNLGSEGFYLAFPAARWCYTFLPCEWKSQRNT